MSAGRLGNVKIPCRPSLATRSEYRISLREFEPMGTVKERSFLDSARTQPPRSARCGGKFNYYALLDAHGPRPYRLGNH